MVIRTEGSLGEDQSTVNRRRYFMGGWPGPSRSIDSVATPVPGTGVTDRHLTLISLTLLQADRDLLASMRRRTSRWGRLLTQRDLATEMEEDIENRLQELSEFVLDNSPVFGRLRDRLDEVQQAMATVERVEIAPFPSRIDDLTTATNVMMTGPHGPRLPIRMQGLGGRSLAELMVYRAFAAELPGREEPHSPHILACFEEPEAHLHPQAQLAVMRIINQMPGQHIVTTHSPQIAGEADINQVRLFRSSGGEVTVSRSGSMFEDERIKLQRLAERPYGQVLFSRLVIIGEGATERAALPVFARAHWGIDASGRGVTLVDAGSLGNVAPLIGLLENLGIPWLVLADGDKGGRDGIKAIKRRLKGSATHIADRVVRLPDGQDFEEYLVSQGFQSAIKQGIADLYGEEALADFVTSSRMSTVDEGALLIKFLSKKKGTYGAAVAEAIVSTQNDMEGPLIPERIADLLNRADRLLGVDRL